MRKVEKYFKLIPRLLWNARFSTEKLNTKHDFCKENSKLLIQSKIHGTCLNELRIQLVVKAMEVVLIDIIYQCLRLTTLQSSDVI